MGIPDRKLNVQRQRQCEQVRRLECRQRVVGLDKTEIKKKMESH